MPAEGVGTGVVAPGRWGSGVPLGVVHGSAQAGCGTDDLQHAGWTGMMTTYGGNSGVSSRKLLDVPCAVVRHGMAALARTRIVFSALLH